MAGKKWEKDNGAPKRGDSGKKKGGPMLSHDHIRALDGSLRESEQTFVEEVDRIRRQNGYIL